MSEFKVGDDVVLDTCRPNSMNDIRTISSLYENGKCAVTADGRKIRLFCGDRKVHIHATDAEKAAGHRIDEPLEVLPKQPKNTPEPLVSMGEGVLSKDAVREAFEAGFDPRKQIDEFYRAETDSYDDLYDNIKYQEFKRGWQARQAEVDQLNRELHITVSALEIKEQLRETLTNKGIEKQKRIDDLTHQLDCASSNAIKYADESFKYEQRIDELEANLKAMGNHFASKYDAAQESYRKNCESYFEGKSDAYDDAEHQVQKALGGGN